MKQLANTLTVFFVLALLSFTPQAWSFGKNGHRIVAEIAENHLQRSARKRIMQLTEGESLAELGNWPDFIRSDPAWRYADPWHYMNLEDDQSLASYQAPAEGDILTALAHFEGVLRDGDASKQARWEALAFLIHLIGDLHQPLHVGRASDLGGNLAKVYWFKEESNLHKVWDTDLLEFQELSFTEYVRFLGQPSKAQIKSWQASDYLDWAKESFAYRANVYQFGEQEADEWPVLGYRYAFAHTEFLEQRLLQAGIRLAGKLNELF